MPMRNAINDASVTATGIALRALMKATIMVQHQRGRLMGRPGEATGVAKTALAYVVTTFEARQFDHCLPLVRALRDGDRQGPIVVVINGNPGGIVDLAERARFVTEVSGTDGVWIVSMREMVGLARMWNLGIQVAASDICVVLNDDLGLVLPAGPSSLLHLADQAAMEGLAVGNGSWSHFAITRGCVTKVGWFDERFLGFGEEDGDYAVRYRRAFAHYPPDVPLTGVVNSVSHERQSYATGIAKYSLANRVFLGLKYADVGAVDGMRREPPPEQLVPDLTDYAGEDFAHLLRPILNQPDAATVEAALRLALHPAADA